MVLEVNGMKIGVSAAGFKGYGDRDTGSSTVDSGCWLAGWLEAGEWDCEGV